MTARRPPAILALTPGTWTAGSSARFAELERALGRAIEGGLRGLLVREPELPDGELILLAQAAQRLFEGCDGAWLGLHDRPHLVAALDADGVHLGWRSLPPERVRDLVGPDVAIGRSTHAGDALAGASVDYVVHGPVFDTPSKRGLVEPIGVEGLRAAVARATVPVLAIGGLTPPLARAIRSTGAHGLAVRGGILAAPDPGRAALDFARAWEEAPS